MLIPPLKGLKRILATFLKGFACGSRLVICKEARFLQHWSESFYFNKKATKRYIFVDSLLGNTIPVGGVPLQLDRRGEAGLKLLASPLQSQACSIISYRTNLSQPQTGATVPWRASPLLNICNMWFVRNLVPVAVNSYSYYLQFKMRNSLEF